MKIGTPDGDYLTNEVQESRKVQYVKASALLPGIKLAEGLLDEFEVTWVEQAQHSDQIKFGAASQVEGVTATFYAAPDKLIPVYMTVVEYSPIGDLLREMREIVRTYVGTGDHLVFTYLIRMGEQLARINGTER